MHGRLMSPAAAALAVVGPRMSFPGLACAYSESWPTGRVGGHDSKAPCISCRYDVDVDVETRRRKMRDLQVIPVVDIFVVVVDGRGSSHRLGRGILGIPASPGLTLTTPNHEDAKPDPIHSLYAKCTDQHFKCFASEMRRGLPSIPSC